METTLSYLAGLFDGEGSFSIQVNVRHSKTGRQSIHFIPKMSMTLRYGTEVLSLLTDTFGGNLYQYKDGTVRWSMGRKEEMKEAALALQPYLRIKTKQCRQFLEALSLFPESNVGINRAAGERAWSEENCLRVATIALTMNEQSARKTDKKLDYLDNIRNIYVDAILTKEES